MLDQMAVALGSRPLSTETLVTDSSGMALFDVQPRSFDQVLREALAEERGVLWSEPVA